MKSLRLSGRRKEASLVTSWSTSVHSPYLKVIADSLVLLVFHCHSIEVNAFCACTRQKIMEEVIDQDVLKGVCVEREGGEGGGEGGGRRGSEGRRGNQLILSFVSVLQKENRVINWSDELVEELHSKLYPLWNRTAGDCLLDSALQATWGVSDRDSVLRKALADSLSDCSSQYVCVVRTVHCGYCC